MRRFELSRAGDSFLRSAALAQLTEGRPYHVRFTTGCARGWNQHVCSLGEHVRPAKPKGRGKGSGPAHRVLNDSGEAAFEYRSVESHAGWAEGMGWSSSE